MLTVLLTFAGCGENNNMDSTPAPDSSTENDYNNDADSKYDTNNDADKDLKDDAVQNHNEDRTDDNITDKK